MKAGKHVIQVGDINIGRNIKKIRNGMFVAVNRD